MKTASNNRKSGLTKTLLIVAGVMVVGAVGYFVWQTFGETAEDAPQDAALNQARAECEKENDKDICRFATNWKTNTQYRMVSIGADGSQTTFEIDGDKTHMVITGDYPYETITIGDTTYIKAGDVWYKQTAAVTDEDLPADPKIDFQEPADESETDTANKTVYKKLGKEACGGLTCFKYEVVGSQASDGQMLIWFDDKDYRLRKTVSQMSDGTSTETTYAYSSVSISEPSPVRELGPDQYIVPGQTEPQTMPSANGTGL